MGRVDLVIRRDRHFDRLFAMKRLHEHLLEDEAFREMFLDEARISGLLRHPNVVSVVDVGEDGEGPFLVMEYIEGVSAMMLQQQAQEGGQDLPLSLCLDVVAHAAAGLHAAHELRGLSTEFLGLVHRDVSPQNILIGFDGVGRVTDFGIAKAAGRLTKTAAGVKKGKSGYMAPEQMLCEEPDRRSDVFSLGIVLFELLTFQRVNDPAGQRSIIRDILAGTPPDLADYREDAPPALVELVFRMLAKDREVRPQTADEVADTLTRIVRDLPEGSQVDVGLYLQAHFGDIREEHRTRVASAQHVASLSPPENRPRGWSGVGRVAAAAAAALIGTAGWWAFESAQQDLTDPSPPLSVTTEVASPPSMPVQDVLEPASRATPVVHTTVNTAVADVQTNEPDTPRATRPQRTANTRRRAKRPPVSQAPSPAATAPTEQPSTPTADRDRLKLWGWQ